jgi:capsular exopolysaccharide synthesis family protein
MVKGNERVLIIDANFRNPAIHSIFHFTNKEGFLDVLKGTISFERTVHHSHIKNLDILTSGELNPSSLEVINSHTVSEFMKDILEKYDRIVIDAPPVLEAAEARFLASKSDGVILVTNRYVTKIEDFAKAKRALEVADANVLGVVLNEKARSRWIDYFF